MTTSTEEYNLDLSEVQQKFYIISPMLKRLGDVIREFKVVHEQRRALQLDLAAATRRVSKMEAKLSKLEDELSNVVQFVNVIMWRELRGVEQAERDQAVRDRANAAKRGC